MRFGLTYTVYMVFKSESINPCMHTQVATNVVPDLTFHVKYESFCFCCVKRSKYDKCLTLVSRVCCDV